MGNSQYKVRRNSADMTCVGTPRAVSHFQPLPSTDRIPQKNPLLGQSSYRDERTGKGTGQDENPRYGEIYLGANLAPPGNSNKLVASKSATYVNGSYNTEEEESANRSSSRNSSFALSRKSSIPKGEMPEMPELTKEQYKLLRMTCDIIKRNDLSIGHDGLKQMMEEMPKIRETFNKSPNRPIRNAESWELMGQGIMILHALDKMLSKANKPKALKKHICLLLKDHVGYGVKSEDFLRALAIFEALIQRTIGSKDSNFRFGYNDVREAWETFFAMIRRIVQAA